VGVMLQKSCTVEEGDAEGGEFPVQIVRMILLSDRFNTQTSSRVRLRTGEARIWSQQLGPLLTKTIRSSKDAGTLRPEAKASDAILVRALHRRLVRQGRIETLASVAGVLIGRLASPTWDTKAFRSKREGW
jgi:hypothetical protein